jgi:carboxylate-amine ligase
VSWTVPRPRPAWAAWPDRDPDAGLTLGVEEEVMLLTPGGWNLAQASDEVLPRLRADVRGQFHPETHQAAIEITTGVHGDVRSAIAELRGLRDELRATAAGQELAVASSGTHPFAMWRETAVGRGARQAEVYGSMRELARREPTFALHVHVGMPDAESAIVVLDRLRVHLPMLLALSANSPFWQGRDTGLASARTPLFQAFPRVGIPRRFGSYAEWVRTVDLLVRCEAFPDPTYLWWDVRIQPRIGTIEIRIMDAQADLVRTGALVALVQCLTRLELHDGWAERASNAPQEVWDENRFLAARDGGSVELIAATLGTRVPLPDRVADLLDHLRPHAAALHCVEELEQVALLVAEPGAEHQLRIARRPERLPGLVRALADEF